MALRVEESRKYGFTVCTVLAFVGLKIGLTGWIYGNHLMMLALVLCTPLLVYGIASIYPAKVALQDALRRV